MINRWKAELKSHGFQPLNRSKTTFVRERGFCRQTIWEARSRFARDKILVNLGISLLDRFLETPDHVSCLVAHTHPDRVLIEDYGEGKWWQESAEEAAALAALLQYGLPWLEEFSRTERLISYLEQTLRDGIPAETEPRDWTARLAERLLLRPGGVAGPQLRRPPVYHYYLSLLYDESGDQARACAHARTYLAHVSRGKIPGEPERTLRQLGEMKCPQTEF